ncbi:hypothetical protein AB6A40_003732 [Gnathostoma spinigerum]|uniref:Uncharacterized protein n=1 Tax=Gnathostoma spinigerum TaxID=75299 RepID=A0ABD6EJ71_9BILA
MDFGKVIVSDKGEKQRPRLLYHSLLCSGKVFEFEYAKTSIDGQIDSYVCSACRKMRRRNGSLGPLPRVKVAGGRFITDPDNPINPHYCIHVSAEKVQGSQKGLPDAENALVDAECSGMKASTSADRSQKGEDEESTCALGETRVQKKNRSSESAQNSANHSTENALKLTTSQQNKSVKKRLVDFGEAVERNIGKGVRPIVLYHSREHDGKTFEFGYRNTSTDGRTRAYICRACRKLQRRNKNFGPVPRVKVMNGRFITDPDNPENPHYCLGTSSEKAVYRRQRYAVILPFKETFKDNSKVGGASVNESKRKEGSDDTDKVEDFVQRILPHAKYNLDVKDFSDFAKTFNGSKEWRQHRVLYRSRLNAGTLLEFEYSKTAADGRTHTYLCSACRRLRRKSAKFGPIPRVKVVNGCFVVDPDNPVNAHYCLNMSSSKLAQNRNKYTIMSPSKMKFRRTTEVSHYYVNEDMVSESSTVSNELLAISSDSKTPISTVKRANGPVNVRHNSVVLVHPFDSSDDISQSTFSKDFPVGLSQSLSDENSDLINDEDVLDFGSVTYVAKLTKARRRILYKSRQYVGTVFEFEYKKTAVDGFTHSYLCSACKKLRRSDKDFGPVPQVKVINNRFVTDPDNPANPHFCITTSSATILTKEERHVIVLALRKKLYQSGAA